MYSGKASKYLRRKSLQIGKFYLNQRNTSTWPTLLILGKTPYIRQLAKSKRIYSTYLSDGKEPWKQFTAGDSNGSCVSHLSVWVCVGCAAES